MTPPDSRPAIPGATPEVPLTPEGLADFTTRTFGLTRGWPEKNYNGPISLRRLIDLPLAFNLTEQSKIVIQNNPYYQKIALACPEELSSGLVVFKDWWDMFAVDSHVPSVDQIVRLDLQYQPLSGLWYQVNGIEFFHTDGNFSGMGYVAGFDRTGGRLSGYQRLIIPEAVVAFVGMSGSIPDQMNSFHGFVIAG